VLAHWNNSPRVNMSLHSDTLFWFRANQYVLFLRNAMCLAEKQQIPISYSLVWPDRGSNPRDTALEASTLTITPAMRCFWLILQREYTLSQYDSSPPLTACKILVILIDSSFVEQIRVITKLPNSEQSYKGKVKTHKYINRQNQSTTGKLWKP
jgi:hypothetical protein